MLHDAKRRGHVCRHVIGLLLLAAAAFTHANPPAGAQEIDVTGDLTILYKDDFTNERFELEYLLRDRSGNRQYRLHFEGKPPGHLRTGMKLTVRGKAKDKELFLAADGVETVQASVESSPVTGEQKVVVIIGNFTDANVACSADQIRDIMFNDAAGNHVDALYREMSHDAVSLRGNVTGPYPIDFSSTDAVCDTAGWADALDATLLQRGVNLSVYDRKIYVLPSENSCGFSGLGTVGGNPSRARVLQCDRAGIYAHELGHNVGMNHASTPAYQYGDSSDIMGAAGRLYKINAPHYDQMGWVPDYQIVEITQSGIYDIAPLGTDPAHALAPQMLKIAKPDSGDFYYLSFRQPIGFDENISSGYHGKTSIHTYTGDDVANRTFLLGTLQDSESFSDAVNGLDFIQLSHTDSFATVQVEIENTPQPPPATCTPSTPDVTLSPAAQSAEAGVALGYSISVVNQDDSNCADSSFSLAANLPAGWIGSLSPSSLSLAPGVAGSASLTVTSAPSAQAATYPITIDVTDSSEAVHTSSGSASYTVLESCTVNAPSLVLSPVNQSGDAGATLSYSVTLLNNDAAACGSSTFELNSAVPAGWSGMLAPSAISLSPGASGTAVLQVTSSSAAAAGNYSLEVNTTDSQTAGHGGTATATYSVNQPPPAGDTEAPTIPTGLGASTNFKQVSLSWNASSDNVGVAGYRVTRDGVLLADTADTGYTDTSGADGVVYDYRVSAYDEAGNQSAESAPVTAGKDVKTKGGSNGKGNTK